MKDESKGRKHMLAQRLLREGPSNMSFNRGPDDVRGQAEPQAGKDHSKEMVGVKALRQCLCHN